MYIATIPNRDSPLAILLREGYREDGKVKTRTLANLSKLPTEADEDQASKASRDPVAPAERSEAALRKAHSKHLDDNSVVHSFRTLLDDLARIVSNTCRCPGCGPETPMFTKTTMPNAKQQKALNLLQAIGV